MNLNRQLRLLPFSALIAVFLLVWSISPAKAHDELVSNSPAQGAVVEAGITELELEYSAELMTVSESAEIIVLDPNGELVNNGCAAIEGRMLTTRVDLDRIGTHTVSWRAVSSDGHPIEGTFTFQVTNDSGYESAGLVAGTECDWAITELGESSNGDEPGLSGSIYWLLWLLLPIAGIGVYFWLRPRPKTSA